MKRRSNRSTCTQLTTTMLALPRDPWPHRERIDVLVQQVPLMFMRVTIKTRRKMKIPKKRKRHYQISLMRALISPRS
jgi:hypothetical protein